MFGRKNSPVETFEQIECVSQSETRELGRTELVTVRAEPVPPPRPVDKVEEVEAFDSLRDVDTLGTALNRVPVLDVAAAPVDLAALSLLSVVFGGGIVVRVAIAGAGAVVALVVAILPIFDRVVTNVVVFAFRTAAVVAATILLGRRRVLVFSTGLVVVAFEVFLVVGWLT